MHFCKTIYRYILHLPAQKLLQGGVTLISGLASQLVGYIMIYLHIPSGKCLHNELENHHAIIKRENTVFLWPFSVAMYFSAIFNSYAITRGYLPPTWLVLPSPGRSLPWTMQCVRFQAKLHD